MRKYLLPVTLLVAAACGGEKAAPPPPPPAAAPAAAPAAPSNRPDSFLVRFTTSKGTFDVKVHRDWAPLGADRFQDLISEKFYDEVRFYRVIKDFMAQFGFNGDPQVSAKWDPKRIADDPVKASNTRGMLSYAMAGPGTRTTQLFINFGNNARLDGMGFSPFGAVTKGMDVVDGLYNGYGEGSPSGQGPEQGRIAAQGNAYLKKDFPKLDYIQTARIVEEWKKP